MKTGALLTALFFGGVLACAGDQVPDPFRSADVKWPTYEKKGRSWRYLLGPEAAEIEALRGEPFVKDAGFSWLYCGSRIESLDGSHLYGFKDEEPAYRFVVEELRAGKNVLRRMHDVPFLVYEPTRRLVEVPTKALDLRVLDRLAEEYPETYLGTIYGEWDAGLLYRLPRKGSDLYRQFARNFKMPCGREELAQHFYDYWDSVVRVKGSRPIGLSGPCNLNHIGVERGSTLALIELTLEQSWRSMMMHTRGSGRQYGVPLGFYIAYFLGAHTADTRPGSNRGENWGIAPNLVWRTILLGYYQGCNYQAFESFPWAFVKEVENKAKVEGKGLGKAVKTTVLTENGKVLKKAYDFIRSPAGARGEFYAPILLLADWAHGHDGLNRRISIKDGWGPFANEVPPTTYDQFYQDVLDAISPNIPDCSKLTRWCADHQYQCGLVNSRLGDIFDVYIANPRTKGKELRAEQLAKYAVVMSLGGIKWTDEMKRLVRNYVAAGGTFVNVEGEPPVIKRKLGYGNVLTAPRDREKLADFLLGLQREVLPLRVKTECELVWNAMPDGSWRVCAVNNAGVEKHSDSSLTTYHDEFAQKVLFVPPKDGKVVIHEIMENDSPITGFCWKIPPGGVRIFEIQGAERHARIFDLSKIEDPNRPPYEFPLDFTHNNACDYDEAVICADYDSDEVTVECLAKPLPIEAWKATGRKYLDGAPFMVGAGANGASRNFGPCWKDGRWCLKYGIDKAALWTVGPRADPDRFTKVAATLKDGVVRFFVDDREVFCEEGPILHPDRTAKCTFYNTFTFWRGASSFRVGHRFLGEVKDCHAYSKAIYPLKYEVKLNGEGEEATAAIQKAIDAAVEKTGEVVVKRGVYKVSQLQMRTGVSLHLEEGAVIQGDIIAKGITDFTLLGKGAVEGTVAFEGVQRATVRRLVISGKGAQLTMKDSKNVIVEDSKLPAIDKGNSTRIRVDGKII